MKAPALAAAKVLALDAAKGVPPRVPGMVSAEVIRAYREALAKGQSKASALLFARQAAGAAIGKAAVAPKASPLIIDMAGGTTSYCIPLMTFNFGLKNHPTQGANFHPQKTFSTHYIVPDSLSNNHTNI